ncbi:MAG: nitroreductase family deazaflavin-dependent oxidoreductase [Proteobacteria bacterium]|nr:nitroreductase family deazaflavin-dependent oxidoreductase [Pseudomonadota bacterium]
MPGWITSHLALYDEDPDKGHDWDSSILGRPGILPCLLLTTTGRKTGQPKVSPLIYIKSETGYVVIASKGGAPAHPAWYLNMVDQPNCEIQVRRDHYTVTARDAEGDEREALWKQMAEIYPPYDDYQSATDRAIPVVVLEPSA